MRSSFLKVICNFVILFIILQCVIIYKYDHVLKSVFQWFRPKNTPILLVAKAVNITETLKRSKIAVNRSETLKKRWRDNHYIQQDGILPYARCGSFEAMDGTAPIIGRFRHLTTEYSLLILAVSVWGQSAPLGHFGKLQGTPLELHFAEILVYFTRAGVPCERCTGNHCKMPSDKPTPKVTCSFAPNISIEGKLHYATSVSFDMAAVIQCPFPPSWPVLADQWQLTLSLGDDNSQSDVPVCYHHVAESHEVVLCTEPIYGYDPQATFWKGNPAYAGGDLFQAFMVYHQELMGMQVRVNDLQSSFESPLKALIAKHKWNGVSYRSKWQLPSLVDRNGVWDYEVLAEATCHWEYRFRTKWFMIVHSPDNFVIPAKPNVSLAGLLSKISNNISSIIVPIMQGCSLQTPRQGSNILAQYGRVGPPLAHGDSRHTPIGNPRHIHYSWIHWNIGRRKDKFEEIGYVQASELMQTMHAMALTRPEYDKQQECAIHPNLATLAAGLEAVM